MGAMTSNTAELFSETLDYYLNDGKEYLPALNALAKDDSDAAFAKLMRYVMEGARLAGESGAYRTVVKDTELKDGDRTLKLKAGDRVLVNLFAASRDPTVYRDQSGKPNADKVDPNRPLDSYATLGLSPAGGLGDGINRIALTAMFKVVFKLNKLQKTLGPQGEVARVPAPYPVEGEVPTGPWFHNYLTEQHDRLWPSPQSKSKFNLP
jgi:linoleate 8R-lipoxygenase/9,12-octadecadienoate 8-hydroperoxide 8R-isomerase